MPGWGVAPPSPEHPIYIPVYPDIGFPADQQRPDNTLPGDQPHPDQGLPGDQPHPEHPIFIPVFPMHPIELPPPMLERIKQALSFLLGNLPENPNPHPEPVRK